MTVRTYRLNTGFATWKPIEAFNPSHAVSIMQEAQWRNAQEKWLEVKEKGEWVKVHNNG